MKEEGHPTYHTNAKMICTGCGNQFETGSVMPEIRVTICGNCHPFYTGKEKLVDTEGRVDRFKRKYGQPTAAVAAK